MSPENFCYWLQGALELGEDEFNHYQVKIIKDHLNLVFKKETPDLSVQEVAKDILDNAPDILTVPDDLGRDMYKKHMELIERSKQVTDVPKLGGIGIDQIKWPGTTYPNTILTKPVPVTGPIAITC